MALLPATLLAVIHASSTPPAFELVEALAHPVIDKTRTHSQPGGPNNGYEGGLYMKTEADGFYHLFPSECMNDMKGVRWDIHMQSHHWESPDGVNNWTRKELIYDSSGAFPAPI